jgi:SAM-dependent methyltransferase
MNFPLYRSHIDLAHHYWSLLVKDGDIVIDATCGNGWDSLILAKLNPKILYSIDLQEQAIEKAQVRLSAHLSAQAYEKVQWIHGSHVRFPEEILPGTVKLIVYNLGYLPGGDKSITTLTETTMQSLENGKNLLACGGVISVTCYPGHSEGEREEQAATAFAKSLDPREWSCCYHQWLNRDRCPSLLLIQKISKTEAQRHRGKN